MIENDDQLKIAQDAILNLQKILLSARRVHSAAENRAMSEPILLEIQQREQAILDYLSRTEAKVGRGL